MARTEYLLQKQLSLVLASLMPANRLACEVSLHTGLRISDVLALKTDQVERSSRFWVKEQKTGKSKLVGIPADLRRRLLRQAGEVYVFPSRTDPGRHRTRQAVWADIKRAEWAFRIPQNIGAHSMRKDYAVELMRKYGDIEKVRRALNHSSVEVTRLYALADTLLHQGRT
jgi:integrase